MSETRDERRERVAGAVKWTLEESNAKVTSMSAFGR
jgi:hypothetical protein